MGNVAAHLVWHCRAKIKNHCTIIVAIFHILKHVLKIKISIFGDWIHFIELFWCMSPLLYR